jgi:glutamine amidotransferase
MLRNTQPFARELGGPVHLFAHNGMLPGVEGDKRFPIRRFLRIGDTDRAFDSALITYSLCSVDDPARALAELRRVLHPELGTDLVLCFLGRLPPDAET